jgi:hypothetical protein
MSAEYSGYFIDWDGNTRPVEKPGKGYRAEVDMSIKYVEIKNKYGATHHESTFYPTLEAVAKAGLKVNLVETDD